MIIFPSFPHYTFILSWLREKREEEKLKTLHLPNLAIYSRWEVDFFHPIEGTAKELRMFKGDDREEKTNYMEYWEDRRLDKKDTTVWKETRIIQELDQGINNWLIRGQWKDKEFSFDNFSFIECVCEQQATK